MARVLVVEDSPDQARLIAGLLESGGFTAEIAPTGERAIEAMAKSPPDLVITDLIMPGINGLELVERIKERYPHVPVILMTAFGSGEIAARALQNGAASYVPKRRLHDELVSTVRETLSVAHARREERRIIDYLQDSEHRFVLENDPNLVPPLVAWLQGTIRSRIERFDDTELMQIGIALHEALINAMHHGNLEVSSELRDAGGEVYRELIEQRLKDAGYRDRRVFLTVNLSASELVCVIRDEGPGFDPRSVADPTALQNLEKVSGRGLYLIWTFMDRVAHNETGNQITLVKQFEEHVEAVH